MKKIFFQAIKFFGISGIGWLIDMVIFTALTNLEVNTILSNIISSLVAVTFVYFTSTKKIFINKNEQTIFDLDGTLFNTDNVNYWSYSNSIKRKKLQYRL